MMESVKKDSSKKYKLTSEEVKNLKGREMAVDYLQDLIKRDIGMYLQFDVFKRLGIESNVPFQLSEDREWVELTEEKPKIIVPNGKV